MLRSGSTTRYPGQTACKFNKLVLCAYINNNYCLAQYNNAAEMNTNLFFDISARHEAHNYYGETLWFAGHRNGQSGLSNPATDDIKKVRRSAHLVLQQTNTLVSVYVGCACQHVSKLTFD